MKQRIAGMAATLLAAVLLFSPKAQAISAQHGVLLDAGTGRLLFERNADAYFGKLEALYPDARIFAILPLWRADGEVERPMGRFDACYEILGKVLRRHRLVTPISGKKLTPHMPEFYSDARLHPNDTGFLIYARNLVKELDKRLSAK